MESAAIILALATTELAPAADFKQDIEPMFA
jgi:hypothetical protein